MNEIVNSEQSLKDIIELITQTFNEFKYIDVEIKVKGKARSGKQNKSLHAYLRNLSYSLNEAGYDMSRTLAHKAEIPWDKDGRNAKEFLWRPVQKVVTGKESSTEPTRQQYIKIYEVLNRHFSKMGIHVPWPCEDDNAKQSQ